MRLAIGDITMTKASAYFRSYKSAFPKEQNPLEHFLFPGSLDDTGSMCAAMIQAYRGGYAKELKGEIDRSIDFILNKVIRLSNGAFARNRPMPNSVFEFAIGNRILAPTA